MKVSNETKVGALTVISLALLILGYNFLKGGSMPWLNKEIKVFVEYNNIEGLGVSDPVQIAGYTVGRVSDIELIDVDKGTLRVELIIDKGVKIKTTTKAQISSADLLGEKAIYLIPLDSVEMLNFEGEIREVMKGDELIGTIQPALPDAIRQELIPLKLKVEELLKSVDESIDVIKQLLNEENREKVDQSFASIEGALKNFKNTSKRLDTLIQSQATKLNNISSNVESITSNVRKSNQKVSEIIDNSAVITKSIAESDIKGAVANAEAALNDFSEVMNKINKGKGSLGKLLKDDKLYDELLKATTNLDVLLEDIEKNPDKYIRIRLGKSDYEKEQEKLEKKEEKAQKKADKDANKGKNK